MEKMSFDNDITSTLERMRACGLMDIEQARNNFALLRTVLGRGFAALVPGLQVGLSGAADPDMALNNFERFVSTVEDIPSFLALVRARPDVLTSLITIFGASRFLSTYLVIEPVQSLSLLSDPGFLSPSPGRQSVAERLSAMQDGVNDEKGFFRALRLFRKQEMLRIGLRDLLNKADLRETVADLSDLAEVCLQKAYEWADNALAARYGRPLIERPDGSSAPARFAVIAMGKLGGRELNFSSDVDLMYVYTADGETQGTASLPDAPARNRITNHEYFIKLAEKLTAAIGEKTADGFVFRVDLRLRPEGQRGPLAQSLGSYEIYYESWGQTWERSALVKARPVAGDEALGREFLERVTPFVFRKYLDFGALAEIRDMKQKINKDVEQKGRTYRDVKLGYGGIREIEFVVQALQLIYAGRDRTLREKSTMKALHILSQKGLITYEEYSALARAYVFLRMVEHRIQIPDDLQTQIMPEDGRGLRALARRAGYLQADGETDSLLRDYAGHTNTVRSIYDNLFAFTGREAVRPEADYDMLLNAETTEQEGVSLFSRHGFRDPGKAYRNLLLLREGSAFVHQTPRSRKLFNDIFPSLFREIVSSPDPDMALHHLESLLAAQGSWESIQPLLKFDPSAGKMLIAILANSEYFSRMLIRSPILLQNLLESRQGYGAGTRSVFSRDLLENMQQASGISEKLDALRRFKHREELRIGMADLLSNMDGTAVSRDLSKLAEACLDAALRLARSETGSRYNTSDSSGLAVIGVGKLGGRELTYGSDLDILFVYSGPRGRTPGTGLSWFEYFSKVAEKTISYLSTLTREGFAFRVDTRLRPTGSKGPLVQSIEAFKAYYGSQAQTWERQALVRARYVAGDRAVGLEFCSEIQDLIYRVYDKTGLAKDIRNMRSRMEEEIGKEQAAFYNIKQGQGGIVDVEFIAQYLQLLEGNRHPRIRVPGTGNALRALRNKGLLAPEEYTVLSGSYFFLRRIESRLRIVSNRATAELSKRQDEIRTLARRMGYEDGDKTAGQQLLDEYRQVTLRVRKLFQKILDTGQDPSPRS